MGCSQRSLSNGGFCFGGAEPHIAHGGGVFRLSARGFAEDVGREPSEHHGFGEGFEVGSEDVVFKSQVPDLPFRAVLYL